MTAHRQIKYDPSDKLVHMANQIGAFFETQREDTRVPGIADHIGQCWDKKMRRDIYGYIDRGGDGLNAYVVAALQQLRKNER